MWGGSLRIWEWNTTGKLTMSLPFTIVCRCMSVANSDSWHIASLRSGALLVFAKGLLLVCYIWRDWMCFCSYVDSLLGAYKQYSTKLGYGGLDKEVRYGASELVVLAVSGFVWSKVSGAVRSRDGMIYATYLGLLNETLSESILLCSMLSYTYVYAVTNSVLWCFRCTSFC